MERNKISANGMTRRNVLSVSIYIIIEISQLHSLHKFLILKRKKELSSGAAQHSHISLIILTISHLILLGYFVYYR